MSTYPVEFKQLEAENKELNELRTTKKSLEFEVGFVKKANEQLRADIKKRKEDQTKLYIHLENTVDGFDVKWKALQAENERLKKAFDKYGCHDFECNESGSIKCICGFEQALQEKEPQCCVCLEEITEENAHLHRNCGK